MNKVVFLHPMKTGGTTVQSFLKEFKLKPGRFSHSNLSTVIDKLGGEENFQECYSFMVSRNPYARLSSFFGYCSKMKISHAYKICQSYSFDFKRFVDGERENLAKICKPQTEFCLHGNRIFLDKICRFETIVSDLREVFNQFGHNIRLNQNKIRPWRHNYNRKLCKIVASVYEKDFYLLDYDIDV